MTDTEQIKEALATLAERDPDSTAPPPQAPSEYRETIRHATSSTNDISAAAEFVETVGLDELEAAVEHAEHEVSRLAEDGRTALATFREFRTVANADDYFHHGDDTSLGDPGIPPDR